MEGIGVAARTPAAPAAPAPDPVARTGGRVVPIPGSAPPLALPAEHLLAGLGFYVAGGVGLAVLAPSLARGGYADPRVAAVTHLFTLGWITTSIMGALYQLLPVALGGRFPSRRLGHLTFGLHVGGVSLFVCGLATGRTGMVIAGAATLGTGLLLFAWHLAAALRGAARRDTTWRCLAAADAFLVVAVSLGVLLAVNLRTGFLGPGRFLLIALHLHVAAVGWVLLVIVGVSRRLLPMFLLSHGVTEEPGRAAAWLLALGAAVLALVHHVLPLSALPAGGGLLAAGGAAFVGQGALHFRGRRRPSLDPGMRLVAVALALLAVAVVLGVPAMLMPGASPRLATAYVAALVVGGLGLFVAGHQYKILPFLVWHHRFGPVASERPVPMVAELFARGPALASVGLQAVGAAGLVGGILAGSPAVTRAAALLLACGALVETVQLAAVARRRPA
ncbi:MAG: hypothetical protein Q8W51_05120 [Candidatus Palauibacterales bacterium]|nr:hypothetical protein [Candidatus Palauibacterales bacterium]MDP2529097.1 hypothetical protein [Candidatus Palauibacterales bacterium]MDP2584279.1 hypothetical protein [Candidatus Palauibacterales bacterium]